MDVKEFYERREEVMGRIFSSLQAESQKLVPFLGNVEVLEDRLLEEFMAFNYLYALDFQRDGKVIMGEFGGVIPQLDSDGHRAIAISDPSMQKISEGIKIVKK